MVVGKGQGGKAPKTTSPAQARREAELLSRIEELKAEHPFWGYRRIWAALKFKDGLTINKKRAARLMRLCNLGVKRSEVKASRIPSQAKPRPHRPNQWWGLDMTKIMTSAGWAYLVIVLDWYSKKIVGWDLGYQSKAKDWLRALDQAVNRQFPQGVKGQGLHLMSDNGCQPTATSFMAAWGLMGINQAFTSYNNPKGNADTERMIRTIKEELLWLHEWSGLDELKAKTASWI